MSRGLTVCLLLTSLAALALLRPCRRAPCRRTGEAHNPLELWNVAGTQLELGAGEGVAQAGPSIRCNITTLHGTHEWVEVSWSGLPFKGGCCMSHRVAWELRPEIVRRVYCACRRVVAPHSSLPCFCPRFAALHPQPLMLLLQCREV